MLKKRILATLVSAVMGIAVALDAVALGFGPTPRGAVVGLPLDLLITLRLDPGETLTGDCVATEVTVGERRLPPGQVRSSLEGGFGGSAVLRVRTVSALEEPVIEVHVSLGCPARFARRFVLFAEQPATAPAAPAVARVGADGVPALARPAAPVAAPALTTAAKAAAPAPTVPARASPAVRPGGAAAPRAARPSAAPRLQLDAVEPRPAAAIFAASDADTVISEAIAVVAQAASAARASAAAASASALRIATLEQTVEQMRADAQASREALAKMQARVTQAEGEVRWTTPLLLALLVLACVALVLAWRLRLRERSRLRSWWQAAAQAAEQAPAAGTSPIPLVTAVVAAPPPAVPPPPLRAPAPLPSAAEPPTLSPPPVAPNEGVAARGSIEGARDVSIDELIDLEQQAEFFVVLGQHESAIDLLVEHLRQTGGGSPLPYLKLLEIYRRCDDRDAYERTRARFNHRFNAYAPDWGVDLVSGRALETYADIVGRLQQVWARPIDAMAELEALLFRKSRGELFELPAYRDVLILYSIARDLLEREPVDAGAVDLLLPLEAGVDSVEPFATALSPEPPLDMRRVEDWPTVPLDLEIEPADPPASRFGGPGPGWR